MQFSNTPINLSAFRAINAREAASTVSAKYDFIPTTQALSVLSEYGWYPTSAKESRTRKEALEGYQTHSIRLQNESMTTALQVGSTIPQLALRNAHGGTSAFVLDLALLELRCLNGLMVDLGSREQLRILHRNFDSTDFETTLRELTSNFNDVMTSVDRWRGTVITERQQRAYADAAIELRWDGSKYAVDRDELIAPTRLEERERTLWNTYNVVQEKLIKGGIDQQRLVGSVDASEVMPAMPSKRKARPIANIREDARLNKALWKLTAALEEQL
jgi:Domain of unknown function (DUF932).